MEDPLSIHKAAISPAFQEYRQTETINKESLRGQHHHLYYLPSATIQYDDTTVFASDSDNNGVHASVNRELIGVDNWLKSNRLSLNFSKTSYMMI